MDARTRFGKDEAQSVDFQPPLIVPYEIFYKNLVVNNPSI